MKPNLIVTGASGLLGQYLCRHFANDYNVVGLYNRKNSQFSELKNDFKTIQINLTKSEAVRSLFAEYPSAFVIHAAGLASVDACEENPELAHELNVEMTSHIVQNLDPQKTRLIHISTDHLFSGKDGRYSEESNVHPINVYAQTKYKAENIVQEFSNGVSVRTNFYGGETPQKMSFSNWIFHKLTSGQKINVFEDVYFTPVSIPFLAENIEKIMNSNLQGIYNVSGAERISKFEFARRFVNYFKLNPELIIKSTLEKATLKAARPHDMSLSSDKIKANLTGFQPEVIESGFARIRAQNLI
jgi:dTDP-4-dehydrorhamnose reductase